MNRLQFDKYLSEDTLSTIGELEEIFHQIFRQITYFQNNLNKQTGKASAALKDNLNQHLNVMGKSSVTLLHFADVMYHLMKAIQETDNGNAEVIIPAGRQAWKYSLSPTRIEEEISLDSSSMIDAATDFQNNLDNINDLFSSFDKMLMNVMTNSDLPWDDYSNLWNEAKDKISSITSATQDQITKLIDETNQFIDELTRLDKMIADTNLVV